MTARSNKHPLYGTSFLAQPAEQHAFVVDPKDDYRCAICHRCRALHQPPEDEEPSETAPSPPRVGRHHGNHRTT